MVRFIILVLAFCVGSAQAEKLATFGNLKVEEVVKVRNGGVFRANLKDVPPIIADDITIVIGGLQVPRFRNAECDKEKQLGLQARNFTQDFLTKATRIDLRNVRRGKKFRIIADVYGDSINLATELIRTRHAVKKTATSVAVNWCR